MPKCFFDGCKNQSKGKRGGLCHAHLAQKYLRKPLKPLQRQVHGLSEYERFVQWIDVRGPDECWPWKGFLRPLQYGQFRNALGKPELANRAAWRLFKGPIPEGMFVLHKCDNPTCVNPSHLFIGNQQDNMTDMWRKGRARPGVSLGEKHGMSKLTEAAVRDIRSSSDTSTVLARKHGVAISTICDVRKRKIWKHVT